MTSNERLYDPNMELSWQTFLGNRGPQSWEAREAFIAAWYASRTYAVRSADETLGKYPEYTNEIGDAGQRYMQQRCGGHISSGFFYWHELWDALNAAAYSSKETLDQDSRQTPAPSGHAGLGTTGRALSPDRSSEKATELRKTRYCDYDLCADTFDPAHSNNDH